MANNDNGDFNISPRNKRNNNRNIRSSKSNIENENKDILDGLNLKAREIGKVQKKALEGEKKITEEKKKQNKEDEKHLKNQEKIIKNNKESVKSQEKQIENEKKISNEKKKQFNNEEYMKQWYRERQSLQEQMYNLQSQQTSGLKEQEKLTRGIIRTENDRYSSTIQQYQKKLELDDEFNKSQSDAMKNLVKRERSLHNLEYKNKQKLSKLNDDFAKKEFKSLEEKQKAEEEYSKAIDKLIRSDERRIKNQKKITEQKKKQAEYDEKVKQRDDKYKDIKTNSFKEFGVNTNSDIFKYFSQRKTASSEDKKFLAASAKLEIASTVIETVAKSIKTIIDKWTKRFFDGMDKIVSVYENTYSQVAAITGINEAGYQKWQNDTAALLMSNGTNNAVTISEAMTDVARLTKDGFTDMNKASEMAVQNIQNRIINPFVDTTTEAYENLQNLFGTQFTKKITGMSSYLADIAGSNRVFKSSINDVIDKLEPVALSAEKDLLGDAYAYVEALVKEGGMTQKQAIEFVSSSANGVADPYGALNSGDVTLAAAIAQGKYGSLEEMMLSRLGTASLASSSNPLAQGAALQGLTGSSNGIFGSYSDFGKIMGTVAKTSKETSEANKKSENYYNLAMKRLQNGDLTTNSQEKANIAENAATWLATFKEQYPDWYSSLETIAKTVGSILTAIVGGHLFSGITNLFGKGRRRTS